MGVLKKDKEAVFDKQFSLIYDEGIREFTRLCVIGAPDYFFTACPASTSGKYHPIDELGWDGTIIHTKKVVHVAYEFCKAFDCLKSRDLILSACVIHDLRKQGIVSTGHTTKNHPDLASRLVKEVYDATMMIDKECYEIIRNCVGYHYGPWSVSPWIKPLKDYTPEEQCVYYSDYIASKTVVDVVDY